MKKQKAELSNEPHDVSQKDGREFWYYEEPKGILMCDGSNNFPFIIPWKKLMDSVERYKAFKKARK